MNILLVNLYKACHLDIHKTYIKNHFDVIQETLLYQWWRPIGTVFADQWTQHCFQMVDMTEKDLTEAILTTNDFSWKILTKDDITTLVKVINPFKGCKTLEEANIRLDMEIPENGILMTEYSDVFIKQWEQWKYFNNIIE